MLVESPWHAHATNLDRSRRCHEQLHAEQQQNASLRIAVRSVQRSQAAAANAFLAGVTSS
jgi:hypothetical protein